MSFIKKGYFDIFLSGMLWGLLGVFVTTLNAYGISSSVSAFIRMFFGIFSIGAIMLLTNGIKAFVIDKKGLLICVILGIFSQGMFNYCYNASITSTGIATASILLYTAPVFVCIMSKIFFKEDINNYKKFALFINILGCVLTVTGGNFSNMQFSYIGIIFGVSAGFLYGLMTIISKTTTDKYNSFTILFYSFIFGAVFLFFTVQPYETLVENFNVPVLITSILYGLIPTAISYVLYMRGLSKKPETSKVPIIASIETVTAAFIGFIIFNENFGMIKLIGILCVLLSIVLMNFNFKNKKHTI